MQQVLADIEARVPGARRATDSAGRETDIAIDHSEFTQLPQAAIDACVAIMRAAGMMATVSSIHINGWYGAHNKLEGARWMVRELLGRDLDAELSHWVCGRLDNDQLMFEHLRTAWAWPTSRASCRSSPAPLRDPGRARRGLCRAGARDPGRQAVGGLPGGVGRPQWRHPGSPQDRPMTRLVDLPTLAALVRGMGQNASSAGAGRRDPGQLPALGRLRQIGAPGQPQPDWRDRAHARGGRAALQLQVCQRPPRQPGVGPATVMAFGMLAEVATGLPLLLSELTLAAALRTAATSALAARGWRGRAAAAWR